MSLSFIKGNQYSHFCSFPKNFSKKRSNKNVKTNSLKGIHLIVYVLRSKSKLRCLITT